MMLIRRQPPAASGAGIAAAMVPHRPADAAEFGVRRLARLFDLVIGIVTEAAGAALVLAETGIVFAGVVCPGTFSTAR